MERMIAVCGLDCAKCEAYLATQANDEAAKERVAAKWRAQYEWWAHEKIALGEGLDLDVIASVKEGTRPASMLPDEAIIYRFSQELLEQQRVSQACYKQAVDLLGESGVVEMVALLGYYTLVSMILNTFEVPVPEGEITPF